MDSSKQKAEKEFLFADLLVINCVLIGHFKHKTHTWISTLKSVDRKDLWHLQMKSVNQRIQCGHTDLYSFIGYKATR